LKNKQDTAFLNLEDSIGYGLYFYEGLNNSFVDILLMELKLKSVLIPHLK